MAHKHQNAEIPRDKRLTQAVEVLREHGYRVTRPRVAILEDLLRRSEPVSIEELHGNLDAGICDLATVYRCLATFEKLHLVRRAYLGEGAALFEFNLGAEHHHHIVCTACQKVEMLDICVVDALERLVRDRGYQDVSHMLEFFGICGDCSEEKPAGQKDVE